MTAAVYPRLARDSADYANPDGYSVQMQQKERNLEVIHSLKEVNTLPAQWLRDGRAELYCEVRVPQMLYSQPFRCKQSVLEISTHGPLELRQSLVVPHASGKRMYFLPSIVLSEPCGVELSSTTHGVSELWDGQFVSFPKGAILAGGITHEDHESVVFPIDFVQDDSLQAGTMSAGPRQEDESWKYVVKFSNDLYRALKDSQNKVWLQAVYVGCVAQMLVAVQNDFRDQEIQRPPAVDRLGEMIRAMPQFSPRLSPPWASDENEWIDTLQLATLLVKEEGGLIAPQPGENED